MTLPKRKQDLILVAYIVGALLVLSALSLAVVVAAAG
jgi:hypothetical protein